MNCNHNNPMFTRTPELKHHGKVTCVTCGRFIRWVPKPESLERDKLNHEAIQRIKPVAGLTEWERGFLLSLEKQGRHFSPRQQEILNQLALKYP